MHRRRESISKKIHQATVLDNMMSSCPNTPNSSAMTVPTKCQHASETGHSTRASSDLYDPNNPRLSSSIILESTGEVDLHGPFSASLASRHQRTESIFSVHPKATPTLHLPNNSLTTTRSSSQSYKDSGGEPLCPLEFETVPVASKKPRAFSPRWFRSVFRCSALCRTISAKFGLDIDDETKNRLAREEKASQRYMKKYVKRCPTCHRRIWREAGCQHMECVCGESFCWVCLRAGVKARVCGCLDYEMDDGDECRM
ncbi:hypothetical protein B0O99DRAFT_616955 [Bisporella sp. PMI_857]|nr:hypothetical protein B0O99DRAFT_616955 [Bisporella sp. PMI_857]